MGQIDENPEMGMELWEKIKEANTSNSKEVQNLLQAYGYTKGEIQNFIGKELKTKKKDRGEEIREEIYLRHKLRIRLLQEHTRDANLLVTLEAQRLEESHIIDSLTKLGEIVPVNQGNNGIQQLFGIEQLILKSYNNEPKDLPQLKEVEPEDVGNEEN